jgi:hypothetical protein
MLTAGHVMFEFNEASNPANRRVRTLSGSTVFWDPRGYETAYNLIVSGFGAALPSVTNPNTTFSGEYIEINLRTKDIVFVTWTGNVDENDAGLAVYLTAGDIAQQFFGLNTDTEFERWGDTTRTKAVNYNGLALSGIGLRITDVNAVTKAGDSGGPNYVKFEGKEFIVGNNVSSNQTTASDSSYISLDEFNEINQRLGLSQSGDVTRTEPTNLIVGSSGADSNVKGTFRADIILGRSGDDQLNDGDTAGDTVWANDRLYGGAGNDIFVAGNGNDLIHGGDYRAYNGATARTTAIEDDGDGDSIDYTAALSRPTDKPGVELSV